MQFYTIKCMEVKSNISTNCYHCGELCKNEVITHNEKAFCCEGCHLVYSILDENNLCNYYSIEANPGNAQLKIIDIAKFEYLDLPEVQRALLDFKSDAIHKITFYTPEIHCSSCIWLLENLHKLDQGIITSRVNFLKKEVYVSYNPTLTSLRKIVEIQAKIGYEPLINLSNVESSKSKKTINHSLFVKLGVAGFCFGNIMLLSLPEYISFGKYIESSFRIFFGYLNIALALPVLLYSATEYLIPAYKSVKHKEMSIDVPIAMGIFALFFTSVLEIVSRTGIGYLDSFAGLIFFLLLGKLFQQKTYDFLSFERDFKSYFPISVNKILQNAKIPTMVNHLQKDDIISVGNEELIPVDSELINGNAQVDYSFITGESAPVIVHANEKIFAGGKQMGGTITLRVLQSFSNSDITKLWEADAFQKNTKSEFDQLTTSISKRFTIAIITIAVGSALFWLPNQSSIALKAFTSVLIIACPCALALAAPFTMGNILRIFGRNKFFLKNAFVIEKMAKVNAIVFDKTGTLTNNKNTKVEYVGIQPTNDEKVLIYSLANQSNHPISKQIANYFETLEIDFDEVKEFPGKGIKGVLKGVEVLIGTAEFVGYIFEKQNNTGAYISINGKIFGFLGIKQNYRIEILSKIKSFVKQYKLFVLSGDNNSERNKLTEWFDESNLLFNQTPNDKLQFLKKLKKEGSTTMMIGDGLNDAGALKMSDVGIALNENVANFSPACDAILDAKHFKDFDKFILLSKKGVAIVKVSFILSLAYNIVGMSFAVQGLLTPVVSAILMPLSSISVVVFTTLAVNWSAKKIKLL